MDKLQKFQKKVGKVENQKHNKVGKVERHIRIYMIVHYKQNRECDINIDIYLTGKRLLG